MRPRYGSLALIVPLVLVLGAATVSAQQAPQSAPPATAAKPAKPLPQQGQTPADLAMTKQIQLAVANDKSLSPDAQKVTVITANGAVTLVGSVRTIAERQALENIAIKIAGAGKVTDKTKVKPKKASRSDLPASAAL